MSKIKVPYHKSIIDIEIDDKNLVGVLRSKADTYKVHMSQEEIVERALDNPIGSKSLEELVKDKNNMVIITSDHTRPVPSKITLPIILRRIRKELPNKTIWCFSGYTFDTDILEDMCNKYEETKELISYIDVLVDGKFIYNKKKIGLKFRGSYNQRIIDVKESLQRNEVILKNEYMEKRLELVK